MPAGIDKHKQPSNVRRSVEIFEQPVVIVAMADAPDMPITQHSHLPCLPRNLAGLVILWRASILNVYRKAQTLDEVEGFTWRTTAVAVALLWKKDQEQDSANRALAFRIVLILAS